LGNQIKEEEVSGHVARKCILRNACNFLVEEPERKRPLEKHIVGLGERIILKWIFNK
jgi:hypothetical protein